MKNVSFVPYSSFDKGRYPSIAVNAGGVVIEGHQRELDSKIFYSVGTTRRDGISFGSAVHFDSGAPPRFALNENNLAVEIHKSNGPSDNLWYHVGPIDVQKKTWDHGGSHKDGHGKDPDIALNNLNVAIEVHSDDGNIKCRVGTVDTKSNKISFGSLSTIGSGEAPTVALANQGKVIIVYQSGSQIKYWLGTVSGKSVSLLGSGSASTGKNPSVGMTDDGGVVLGYSRDGNLYSRVGDANANSVRWGQELQYSYGDNPWVDAKGSLAVQAYPSDDFADYSLLASATTIADRAQWMGSDSKIQELTLKQLVIPGSHDAGMSTHKQCTLGGTQCNTRTQFLDAGGQLEMGSRYFDLRPVIYKSSWYTGHYSDTPVGIQGCNGQALDGILDQVASFMNDTRHEVVVLKFSHYYDKDKDKFGFSSDQMKALIDLVKEKLGAALFINQTSDRLADIPLGVITQAGSRVFAVFDDAVSAVDPAAGIYSYADYSAGSPLNADLVVYDEYTGTNDLKKMIGNQWDKQGKVANHGGDLFLLSWTLTQSDVQATVCGVTWLDSIVAIADKADAALYQQCVDRFEAGKITMPTIPNILYVDLSDGFATDVAIYLNQRLAAKS